MSLESKRLPADDRLIPSLPELDIEDAPLSSIDQASEDDDDREDEILNEADGVRNAPVASDQQELDLDKDQLDPDDENVAYEGDE